MAKYQTGLERRYEYRERLQGIIAMMKGAPAEQQNPALIAFLELLLDNNNKILDAAENHKPLACTWYGNAQEILAGMGIVYYNPVMDLMFHLGFTDYADAKECDSFSLDDKVCSLVRYAVWSMENKLHPRPDVFISMMEPCDGQIMLHQAFARCEHLKGVPTFAIDPAYGRTDEDFTYVAKQLKQMIKFLEEKTGAKYDFGRVAAAVEESNEQYRTWKAVNECLRASPCPMPSFVVPDMFWALTQHLQGCDPRATGLMKAVLGVCKDNVAKKVGPVMNEQIRILWPDLNPLWGEKIAGWLASDWNAVVVNSYQGHASVYHDVDTSNEEAMLFGLARRNIDEVPMIRQGRGFVEVIGEDLTTMINEYNINCVLASGHQGHKDVSGATAFMKKTCRDMGVPILQMTTSLFDERYAPLDRLRNEIETFLQASGFKRVQH